MLITQLSSLSSQRASPEKQPLAQVEFAFTATATLSPSTSSQPSTMTALPSQTDPEPTNKPISATTLLVKSHTTTFEFIFTEPRPVDIPCFTPKFAPDNKHYLCRRGQPTRELWLGSLEKGLIEQLQNEVLEYTWGPEGQRVFYSEWTEEKDKPLRVLDLQSKQVQALDMLDSHHLLTFTPDQELVHVQDGQLRMTSLANRQGRLAIEGEDYITDLPFLDENNPYAKDFLVRTKFSPDGQKIVIRQIGFYFPHRLTIVDRQTGQSVEIEAEAGAKLSSSVSWSPDSKTLVYSTLPQNVGGEAGLWLIDADGRNPRQLAKTTKKERFDFLAWLPNGKAVLYVLSPSTGTNFYEGTSYQILGLADERPQTLFTTGKGIQLVGNNLLFYRSELDPWMTTVSY